MVPALGSGCPGFFVTTVLPWSHSEAEGGVGVGAWSRGTSRRLSDGWLTRAPWFFRRVFGSGFTFAGHGVDFFNFSPPVWKRTVGRLINEALSSCCEAGMEPVCFFSRGLFLPFEEACVRAPSARHLRRGRNKRCACMGERAWFAVCDVKHSRVNRRRREEKSRRPLDPEVALYS